MSLVKIGPKHQITIPKEIFEALHLYVGDILEVTVQDGKGIILPKQVMDKAPAAKLSKKEQDLLSSAKNKIATIQENLLTAQGLTKDEADVAATVGLIDNDQKWWWTEEWQRREREAEEDITKSDVSDSFDNAYDLIAHLRKQ